MSFKALKQEYVDDLLDFISQSSFASVILLGGMDSTDRSDAQMLYVFLLISVCLRHQHAYLWLHALVHLSTRSPLASQQQPRQAIYPFSQPFLSHPFLLGPITALRSPRTGYRSSAAAVSCAASSRT